MTQCNGLQKYLQPDGIEQDESDGIFTSSTCINKFVYISVLGILPYEVSIFGIFFPYHQASEDLNGGDTGLSIIDQHSEFSRLKEKSSVSLVKTTNLWPCTASSGVDITSFVSKLMGSLI